MSRFNYSEIAGVARDLVFEFGAPGVAVLPGTGQAPPPNQPWRGRDLAGTVEVPIEIAIVDFKVEEQNSDMIFQGQRVKNQILIGDKQGWVAPVPPGVDMTLVRSVVQDGEEWQVLGADVIKPATEVIAAMFHLRR